VGWCAIRTIGNDTKRSNFIFYNEHFESTFIQRQTTPELEALDHRHARAINSAVAFLKKRLHECIIQPTDPDADNTDAPVIPSRIVLVSTNASIVQAASEFDVECVSLEAYLSVCVCVCVCVHV
jgi:hypothetical protein